jgi:hypothetical protein
LLFYVLEAFKRYFKSCKAKEKRVALGTEQQHVQICRRRSRKEEVCFYNTF